MTQLSLLGRAHAEAASSDHAMATRALFEELANEIERLTRERAGGVSRHDLKNAADLAANEASSACVCTRCNNLRALASRFRAALNQQGETK